MIRVILIVAGLILALTSCSKALQVSNLDVPVANQSEITVDKIKQDVVGRNIEISGVSENLEDSDWRFDADEFKQVEILKTHPVKDGVNIVILMTTRENPRPDEDLVEVSGELQLRYERKGDRWILKDIENLTFRYSVGVAM